MSIRTSTLAALAITTLVALTAAALLTPAGAFAASPQTIIRDASDGSIDGNYSASDLRAADARINPQEREYSDWDYLFQNALRRIANPDTPKAEVAPVRDYDGDGKIGADDVKEAEKRTKKLKKKTKKEDDEQDSADDEEDTVAVEPFDDDDTSGGDDGSDDSSGGLLALLFLIPAVIIGLGVWRMQRARKRAAGGMSPKDQNGPGDTPGDDGPDAPTSSFSIGNDGK